MFIGIEWFEGKYPQFNVSLSSSEGREPFLVVKGCRLVDGSKGTFVSWPATKNEKSGKYWNHVYASEAFNAAVLEKAQETQPQKRTSSRAPESDDLSDIPF